jgi:hypothetical protein
MRKSFNYWAKLATKQTETLDIHKGVLSRFPISIMEANDANLLLDNIFTKLVIPDDGQLCRRWQPQISCHERNVSSSLVFFLTITENSISHTAEF